MQAWSGWPDAPKLEALRDQLRFGTKIAHKTGRARRGRMDAGLVFHQDRPLYALAAYTDHVPETMPDGMRGFSAVFTTISRLSRACWDALVD